ncbi:TIGR02302 family protein [Lutimaribacter marinistellae]|uniref:TIGR02302 family protein n=1 Tax=Lutimaribacter marinistellae TaxID=1820329 RepID=A0ABV7TCZ9_9RHOB
MPDTVKQRNPRTLPIPRRTLWLTRLGMVSERLSRRFWPLFAIFAVVMGALMLGLQDSVAVETVWVLGGVACAGALGALIWGLRGFRWPREAEVLARLDETLPGRPIRALMDDQAIGGSDADSVAVWQAHQARMAARAQSARPVKPDLKLAARDPFALRYVALLVLAVGLIFGSLWRVGSVGDMAPGAATAAAGPAWEGWIAPPRYTGKPTLYLADLGDTPVQVPEGSTVTLRLYGQAGSLAVEETVSGRPVEQLTDPETPFTVRRNGALSIDGPGGRDWTIAVRPDSAPEIAVSGVVETEAAGRMTLPFSAADDYGVTGGSVRITLDTETLDRRYGLAIEPDPREPITLALPLPITGDRREFTETLIEDFSEHPWSNLPVTMAFTAEDAAGNTGEAAPFAAILSGRRFFDPLAAAVIEQRRDLLWSRDNATRVSQILRAVSYRPEDVFRSETAYLRLRVILRRLEAFTDYGGGVTAEQQEEIAQALWDLAILLEEGTLADALERLRRAQDRLSEAMKNGATDQEIAELMQELREATDEYLRQLSRQAQQEGQQGDQQQQAQNGESMQMTQDDLQRMMDRIQELMEQGRMAEAQEALRQLQQMMENMRVTQGQGQNGQSQGQQAMEGLAETLRNQQGLSDQAFRDLQEQFNPGAQSGQSQQNEGRNGGQGRGQSHEGEGGQGQGNNQQGQNGQQGQPGEGSLADRQQALRDELRRQQGSLPGQGTPEGDAARDALDRAGRAMEGAEEALRGDDLAEAIDRQSEAMEALREGMRALGEAMAQEQQGQPGQGTQDGDMRAQNRDPLGREPGSMGSVGTDESLLPGEDVYRRAQELLDEIRKRTGDSERPKIELEYLKRLLDRF